MWSIWCFVLAAISASCHARNNFLLIIVDDLRPALGCYGDSRAYTPNIDRLARSSVVFNKAYAQQALCAPSRNSFLTSRRPDTLGLYDFHSYWRHDAGNYTSLPQLLKDNGYVTASFGKVFHPGASSNNSDDSPYSWSRPAFHPHTDRYKDAPVCSNRKSASPSSNLVCPVHVSSMPNATLPDIETLKATREFLNNNKEPFFLAVGFQKPHIPLKYPRRYLKFHPLEKFYLPKNYEWPSNVSSVAYNPWTDLRWRSDVKKLGLKCPWEKIPEKYARKIIQSYYASVTYIDDLVGQVLNELEILGIRRNTTIIFTSDHGWSLGEHAEWAKYSNFEVALRVPLIVSIPFVTFDSNNDSHKCISNTKCCNYYKNIDDPVELLDIFPTITELVDITIPKCPRKEFNNMPDLCTEGNSLVSLIEASMLCKTELQDRMAISQYPRPGMNPTCNRNCDEPHLHEINIMGYSLRTIRYRYTAWVKFSHKFKKPNWQKVFAEELYDHNSDSEENTNIAYIKKYQHVKNVLQTTLIEGLR